MQNSGCYKCEDRYVGCHENCKRYMEYKLFLQRIKDRRLEEKRSYASHARSKMAACKRKGIVYGR